MMTERRYQVRFSTLAMISELAHLKAVVEGRPGLSGWKQWLDAHEEALGQIFSRGQMLRLRHYPMKEIPKILREHSIDFTPSDFYEWLNSDSTSGRCRECGDVLQRTSGTGGGSVWCPQGCFLLNWDGPRPTGGKPEST